MICDAVARILPAITCPGDPLAVAIASWLALLVAVLSLLWMVFRARRLLERLGAGLAGLAALGLGFAAGLPELSVETPDQPGGHVAVTLDVSESVRRNGNAAYAEAREDLTARIAEAFASSDTEDWTATIHRFSESADLVAGPLPVENAPQTVLASEAGPVGRATDLATGLDQALDAVEDGPGGGSVWLMSDGWATGSAPNVQIQRALAMGVPIHTLGLGARVAGEGLVSGDIGPEQWIGEEATTRLTVLGAGALNWTINGKSAEPLDIADADAPQAVRLPATFSERGLGHVEVSFAPAVGGVQTETLFTLVRGPARILSYGRAEWLDVLPERGYLVDRAVPSDPVDLALYDAIVVDALEPGAFAADMPQKLLNRAAGGAGLLIVNGGRLGAETDMQRAALWEETAIGPVLPVASDPEEFLAEPPRRDVLIVFDTSGSMDGPRLAFAKKAAMRIIEPLRPVDTLTILPFSSSPAIPFRSNAVTNADRARARAFLNSLGAGGGTGIGDALNAAGGLTGNYCAVFVIGDGEYDPGTISNRPICETVTIGVAGFRLPGIDTRNGQALAYRPSDNIADLSFDFFEPEPRDRFWREGPIMLQPAEAGSVYSDLPPISGLALSYLRPEADPKILALEPPPDPVLAFRRDPDRRRLLTGVFLGEIPATWSGSPAARAAIEDMIGTLIGWQEPERFDIRLHRVGNSFDMRVTALGTRPAPARLSATLEFEDRAPVGFNLRPTSVRGEFEGSARIVLGLEPSRAVLELDAGGGDIQAIPAVLPARTQQGELSSGLSEEAMSVGINTELLARIRTTTGGVDLTVSAAPSTALEDLPAQVRPIWPGVASASALIFVLTLFAGGMRR